VSQANDRYGYISGSTANSLKQRRSSFPQPPHKRGLHSNSTSFTLQARGDVTVTNGGGGTTDGQIMFEDLLSQGALKSDGKGGFVGANGFVRHWDSCSSTVS
jgi:chitinase